MNENENIEIIETGTSSDSSDGGVSNNVCVGSGVSPADVSGGNSGENTNTVSSGNSNVESYSVSDNTTVSGGDYSNTDSGTLYPYTENFEKIESGIIGIHSLLLLIFVFLLLEWTEKKFSVIVKRFSERKRR